jgi:hypothetical protein
MSASHVFGNAVMSNTSVLQHRLTTEAAPFPDKPPACHSFQLQMSSQTYMMVPSLPSLRTQRAPGLSTCT